jgi:hypothetical protein
MLGVREPQYPLRLVMTDWVAHLMEIVPATLPEGFCSKEASEV